MIEYFADLHVHIGRTARGEPVKVTASASLTFSRILEESCERKGIDAVGVVDCVARGVLTEIEAMLDEGELRPQAGGGFLYRERLVLFPAAEIEVAAGRGEAHFLSYLPDLEGLRGFAAEYARYVTNPGLSSQRASLSPGELLRLTEAHGGFLVPAHVFTPHKGFYGRAADRLTDVFSPEEAARLPAIELGLSADTAMASRLRDLDGKAFLSNSDAHSPAKIAREYNRIRAADRSFAALREALLGKDGGIVANYGLDPRLGKYHKTVCLACGLPAPLSSDRRCTRCGSPSLVAGVADRLEEVADRPPSEAPPDRPPYVHQAPLEFIPGVGPRTLDRLIEAFGSEMNVLHKASPEELRSVVPAAVADRIVAARSGRLRVHSGGGGSYGRIDRNGRRA